MSDTGLTEHLKHKSKNQQPDFKMVKDLDRHLNREIQTTATHVKGGCMLSMEPLGNHSGIRPDSSSIRMTEVQYTNNTKHQKDVQVRRTVTHVARNATCSATSGGPVLHTSRHTSRYFNQMYSKLTFTFCK